MSEQNQEVVSFASFLQLQENGVLHHDMTVAVEEITRKLRQHVQNYGGKPVAKLKLELIFKLDSDMIDVVGKIDAVLPKPQRKKTTFWPTENDHLSRRNPAQGELALRDVSSNTTKTVAKV